MMMMRDDGDDDNGSGQSVSLMMMLGEQARLLPGYQSNDNDNDYDDGWEDRVYPKTSWHSLVTREQSYVFSFFFINVS